MNTKWLLQFIQTVAEVGTDYVELDLWRTGGQELFACLFDQKKNVSRLNGLQHII